MIQIRPEDSIHKSYLNRILIEVADDRELSLNLGFKGGTAAAMLGYLDRFSVDLDFDALGVVEDKEIRQKFEKIFNKLGLSVAKKFDRVLLWQLKYLSEKGRSNLKVSVNTLGAKADRYEIKYLPEIDRVMKVQTVETMFANKLVAIMGRYNQHDTIAGRDIYDVHHFFIAGYKYDGEVIKERAGMPVHEYLSKLIEFVETKVKQTTIDEDLNTLLTPAQFRQIRKVIIPEVMMLLKGQV
jgi:predicted nucleotidyltransferase component of viral defense system